MLRWYIWPLLLWGAVVFCVGLVQVGAQVMASPAPQLSYVSQYSGDDWHITLMDIQRRVAVDLTRPLFAEPARSRLPSWSPDGDTLAFVSDGGTMNSQIYLLDLPTRQLRQLTETGAYYTLPVWSPDGRLLAFGSLPSVQRGIRVMDIATGTFQVITPRALASAQSPRFSPDGSMLSFIFVLDDNSRHVYIAEPDGDNLRHVFGGTAEVHEPIWSPDGRYLTVTDRRENLMVIHLVDTQTGDIYEVFQTTYLNQDITWSPDGTQLAFSIRTGNGSSLSFARDVLGAVRLGEPVQHVQVLRFEEYTYQTNPRFLPGQDTLVFLRQDADLPSPEIYLTDPDGQQWQRLTFNTRQDWFPTWRIQR